MSDSVEHPSHYNAGSVEAIDAIKSALGDAFLDYCRGNVLKYVWRCRHKGNTLEDLRKAAKYLEWAIGEAEKSEAEGDVVELAEPAQWIPKVGDKVRVIKPLKTKIKHPHWSPEMDKWNGMVGVVSTCNLELRTVLIDGFHDGGCYQWRFSFDWLRNEDSASEVAQ